MVYQSHHVPVKSPAALEGSQRRKKSPHQVEKVSRPGWLRAADIATERPAQTCFLTFTEKMVWRNACLINLQLIRAAKIGLPLIKIEQHLYLMTLFKERLVSSITVIQLEQQI
jgi:hypothetical protein